MKVLLIDVNFKYSSTGKIVYDLYKGINDRGHTAAVGYGRGPLTDELNVYKFSSSIEMYAHATLTRITGMTGYFSPFATRNLLRFIKEFKPDVVHIHELHAYFVNILPILSYLKTNHIKTILTLHCEFMYTGKCGYAYDCNKWKTECGDCPQVKEYPSSLFFDFTTKMYNDKKNLFSNFNNLTIVTPSQWLADRTRESFLKDKQIHVINNGIDTDQVFYPRSFEHIRLKHALNDEKVVLAVAPKIMDERKGGKWVLELSKRFRNEKIKFILIGVSDLSQQVEDNVILLGRTSNQIELAEYYSMADLFVICSHKENFPTTCIEALSCGTPVVGFDEGGTKETSPEGYGAFVPYGNLDELERTVRLAISNQLQLKSAYECALFGKNNYSKEVMVDKYLSLY